VRCTVVTWVAQKVEDPVDLRIRMADHAARSIDFINLSEASAIPDANTPATVAWVRHWCFNRVARYGDCGAGSGHCLEVTHTGQMLSGSDTNFVGIR